MTVHEDWETACLRVWSGGCNAESRVETGTSPAACSRPPAARLVAADWQLQHTSKSHSSAMLNEMAFLFFYDSLRSRLLPLWDVCDWSVPSRVPLVPK